MEPRAGFYPHPVLRDGLDDYRDATFAIEPEVRRQSGQHELSVNFSLTSETLKKLISERRAAFALIVECQRTRVREMHQTDQYCLALRFRSSDFDGRVDLFPFVVAREKLPNFSSDELHQDFEGESFDIDAGDVLAEGLQWWFEEDTGVGRDPKPGHLFLVSENPAHDAPALEYRTQGSKKVEILLPRESFRIYKRLTDAKELIPLVNSMVVAPVLTQIVADIKRDIDEGEHPEKAEIRWYRIIRQKLETMDLNLNPVALAQRILGDPLSSGLKATAGADWGGNGDD